MVEDDLQTYEKVFIIEYLASKEQAVTLCQNQLQALHVNGDS
jgi:hypothetical protein